MKKEEAIAKLSNTKVYVDGKSKEIQEKLFEIGFRWRNTGEVFVEFVDRPFIIINGDMFLGHDNDMTYFGRHQNKEVKADDILSITIDNEYEFKPFDRVLVRSADNYIWQGSFISHIAKNDTHGWRIYTMTGYWSQIIPFEGNEHLVGTSDSPNKD